MDKEKSGKPSGKQRGLSPETMRAYVSGVRYDHIMQVPVDCVCSRTSHEGGSTEIKFVNNLCPSHGSL